MGSTPRYVAATTPALEDLPALVTVPNVELLEVGEDWATSTGVFSFTAEDLQSAITSQEDPGVRTPVLKLGHVDPRFDGQPSLGRIQNMRVENNGQTLVGDLVGVPGWLAAVMGSAYPRRSIEGWFQWETRTGNEWPFVLTGLALLGDSYPAIDTLEDVQALWGSEPPPLYPVTEVAAMQASAPDPTHEKQIRATRLEEDPVKVKQGTVAGHVAAAAGVAASVAVEDVRRAYYDSLDGSQYWWWIRAVMLDPTELIVDDDEGGLYRVSFSTDGDAVTFGEPQAVKIEYVNVAAGAMSVAAAAPRIPVADGQQVAAAYTSPGAAGRPKAAAAGTPAGTVEASGTVTETEPDTATATPTGGSMTDEQRAALRAAHGLPATATDEEIMAAVVASVQTTADGQQPTDDGNPASQPETPATDPAATPATTPDAAPTAPEGVTLPEGMALIDQATLDQLLSGNAAAQELVSAARQRERDELLDGAIRAGKFPKARRSHYEAAYAADPAGTRSMIESLASGLVPVQELGVTVAEGEGGEDASAYPASWGKSVSAARRGAASRVKIVGD